MQKRTSLWGAKSFGFTFCTLLLGASMFSAAAQEAGKSQRFTLAGPDSSFLLAKEYPKTGLLLGISLRYQKPGTVLDTAGINAAPVGSWAVTLGGDGKLTVRVYDPTRQSANRAASGWHQLTSEKPLSPGDEHRLIIAFTGMVVGLQVDGGVFEMLELATPLSGEPVWVGDFPGDERWGSRFDIHPAFTGALIVSIGAPLPDSASSTEVPAPVAAPEPVLPTSGAVLAGARIGPTGGQVKVGTTLQLDIPAGALARSEQITVRSAERAFGGGALYFVERDGQGMFAQPVRITFTLPPGMTAEQVSAVHQLAEKVWQVVPASFDPASRTLSMQVHHFSLVGWLQNLSMRTWVKLKGAVAGAGGGTILLVLGGTSLTAPVSAPATAFLVVCTASGWFAAEPTYDAFHQRGLVGPMRAVGFDIFWEPEPLSREEHFIGYIQRNGRVVDAMAAGPMDKDIGVIYVPLSIHQLAGQLQAIKEWYRVNGYKTPDRTTVLVHGKLGKSSDPGKSGEGEVNAGEFDGKTLSVNIASLKAGAEQQILLATLSHEYWHAISAHNSYKESFVGAEDCLATTFESMVFPGSDDFIKLHPCLEFGRVIANGLPDAGPGESFTTPEMRGYALWPWGQFVYHSQGHEGLRAIATGSLRPELLSSLFVNFTRAVLTTEHALPDPATITQPDGINEQFRTGWKALSLGGLGISNQPLVGPGQLDWPRTPPLSLKRLTVEIPKRDSSQPASRLVVRRREPDPQEQIVLLKPAPSGSPRLDIPRGVDDLVTGVNGTLADAAWTDDANASVFQPVVLVGKSTVPMMPMPGNDLLAYRLAAPLSVAAEPVPATATQPARTKVSWSVAEPGKSLKPHDCFAGYRIVGKTKQGKVEFISDLLYGPAATGLCPPQWYRGGAGVIALDAGQEEVEIPAPQTAAYETIGLQTIDGICREGAGPALSDIAWPQSDILRALQHTNWVSMCFAGAQVLEATNTVTQKTQTGVETDRAWCIDGGSFPGQKLIWNGRNFSLSWQGSMKRSGGVFTGPMQAASQSDWSISIEGMVDASGNLIFARGKATKTNPQASESAAFTLRNMQVSSKVIDANRIVISYTLSGPQVTAHVQDIAGSRTSGVSIWKYKSTEWNRAGTEAQVSLSFVLR